MQTKFEDIKTPTVCIISLTDGSVNPATLFQAVIDPSKLSPNGQHIRFTQGNLCEVHGWKRVDGVLIVETLEEVVEAEKVL